jgi:hypothetical protein
MVVGNAKSWPYTANLLAHPENLTGAGWEDASVGGATFTYGVTAPDSTLTATQLSVISGTGALRQPVGLPASHTYTISITAKVDGTGGWLFLALSDYTANAFGYYFNLNTGVLGSSSIAGSCTLTNANITSLGNGWYLCTVTGTSSTTPGKAYLDIHATSADNTLSGTAGNGLDLWRPQLNLGSSVATYGAILPTPAYQYFGFCGDVEDFIGAWSNDGSSWYGRCGTWDSQLNDINAPQAIYYNGEYYLHEAEATFTYQNGAYLWYMGKADANGNITTIATVNWSAVLGETQTASDNMATNDLSTNWTVGANIGITTNIGNITGSTYQSTAAGSFGLALHTALSPMTDQYSTIVVGYCDSYGQTRAVVRGDTATDTMYSLFVTGGDLTLERRVNTGSGTSGSNVATASASINPNDVITLGVVGSTLYGYINGNLLLTYTDSSPITSGYPGMAVYHTSNILNATISAWSSGTATVSVGIPNIACTFAGEWFVENNGTPHLFVPCSNSTNTAFSVYETHPLNNTLTSWSSPILVSTTGGGTNPYDPKLFLVGTTYYMFLANTTNRCVELFTSTSLMGPYTAIKTGDWAGWGSPIEGFTMFRHGVGWRAIFTSYSLFDPGENQERMYYTDCSTMFPDTGTWSTPVMITSDLQYNHGNVLRTPVSPAGILAAQ